MNTLLLHCRPGFENEVCAAIHSPGLHPGYGAGKSSG